MYTPFQAGIHGPSRQKPLSSLCIAPPLAVCTCAQILYCICVTLTLLLKRRLMTPLERRSVVLSEGRAPHTDKLLLSRLERAESTSSPPLATDRESPEERERRGTWFTSGRQCSVNLCVCDGVNTHTLQYKYVCIVVTFFYISLLLPLHWSLFKRKYVWLREALYRCFGQILDTVMCRGLLLNINQVHVLSVCE